MKRSNRKIYLNVSDLVGHLNCNHLSNLDVQVAFGLLAKSDYLDPLLGILRERGHRHEQAFSEYLQNNNLSKGPIPIFFSGVTNHGMITSEKSTEGHR
jgi:hypothetical protein